MPDPFQYKRGNKYLTFACFVLAFSFTVTFYSSISYSDLSWTQKFGYPYPDDKEMGDYDRSFVSFFYLQEPGDG
jgi:hypothetical protein